MIKPFDTQPMTEGQRKYRDFLASPEWVRVRDMTLRLDDNKCCICGNTEQLEVHHYRYGNGYMFDLYNLVTVCRYCHEVLTNAVKDARRFQYSYHIPTTCSPDEAERIVKNETRAQHGDIVADVMLKLYIASLREGGHPINISNLDVAEKIAYIVKSTLNGQVCPGFIGVNYKMRLDARVRSYRAVAFIHYSAQGFSLKEIQTMLGLNDAQMAKVRKNAVRVVTGSG